MLPDEQAHRVPAGPPEAPLRASDRERERVVEILRDSSADGRLTFDELEQRTAAALSARTRAELSQLTDDLPRSPRSSSPRALDAPPRRRPCRPARKQLAVYVAVNLLLIAVWAATGAGYFWPIWPLLGWGIGIARHARAGAAAPPHRDPGRLRDGGVQRARGT